MFSSDMPLGLGDISGSCPSGQAPTGLDATRFDPGRTQRLSRASYECFRVSPGYDGRKEVPLGGRTYALGECAADTLDGALNELLATKALDHKDHLLIRETAGRKILMHLYAIKRKSAPTYVYEGHVQKRVHRLYAAPVCTMDGGALAVTIGQAA